MGKVGTLKRLVVAVVATTALLVIAAVSGAAPGTDASVTTFDQCANGGPPSTSTACPDNWINGILNANNSHYAEDDVTPQRVVLELPKNSPLTGRTVEISYLTRKGGVHAYDSLATWNFTQTTADRCANLNAADCVPGACLDARRSERPHRRRGLERRRKRDLGTSARRTGVHAVRRHAHRDIVVHPRRRGRLERFLRTHHADVLGAVDSRRREGDAPLRWPHRGRVSARAAGARASGPARSRAARTTCGSPRRTGRRSATATTRSCPARSSRLPTS